LVSFELRDLKSIARCEVEAAVGRLGGDVELYKELVQCFLDDTSSLLPKLRQAIDRRDSEGLHRAGHSLKGLAASCGAQGVAEAAGRLERVGREKQLEELEPAWMALQRALEATRHELANYFPG
jgi:HPt (histidine-containing phosphotransfer) domain-containing protein